MYVKRWNGWRMSCDIGEVTERLENERSSFSKPSVTSPTSQFILILQAFPHFTYVTAHSPTLPSFYLRHNSFSNPSDALPMSQLIFQPFRRFTYVTAHSPTLLLLLLRHRHFTYVTAHSPTLPQLHLRHRSFYNPSVASRQRHFIYVTAHCTALPLHHLRHRHFTYVTW